MAARACAGPDSIVIGTSDGRLLVGKIRNLSDGAIQVLLPEFMDEGSLVTVEMSSGCSVSGEVKYCNPYQHSYCTGIYFESGGTRRFRALPRFEVQESALIAVMNCPARDQLSAHVIDASKSGLGLIVRRPLQANEWVKVETRSCVVFGDVAYCQSHGSGGYKVGLAIETVIFRSEGDPASKAQWTFGAAGPQPKRGALATLLSALGWHRANWLQVE
jgi:hypothetical protein